MTDRTTADWLEDGQDIARDEPTWVFPNTAAIHDTLVNLEEATVDLERCFSLVHDVPIGPQRTIRVTETFTLSSWLRSPRKAALFLNGSVFLGSSWHIPVEGYNGVEMAARRGMFVFTVDFLGSGMSYKPDNGLAADREANTEALRHVLKYIRYHRAVSKIDLVGDGYGGIIATRLAADASRVKSCVLLSMAYKDIVAGPLRSPELRAMLTNSADGYFSLPPETYAPFFAAAPPEVQVYILTTQPGSFPVPAIPLDEPPFFDPGVARVPGLVISGAKDFVIGPDDGRKLALDYGTDGAKLLVHPEAGHVPRVESPDIVNWCWSQIFEFID